MFRSCGISLALLAATTSASAGPITLTPTSLAECRLPLDKVRDVATTLEIVSQIDNSTDMYDSWFTKYASKPASPFGFQAIQLMSSEMGNEYEGNLIVEAVVNESYDLVKKAALKTYGAAVCVSETGDAGARECVLALGQKHKLQERNGQTAISCTYDY